MMNPGYLYVLANSSMPDLVKVGLTTRKPSERAQELSGVTGVPTPFIVVYEVYVNDCDAAEDFVHTVLAKKGYRVSDNREFFKVPVPEVISAIMLLPGAVTSRASIVTEEFDDSDLISCGRQGDDELSSFNISEECLEPEYPWMDLWQEAECHFFGFDDYIKDPVEAFRLYRDAAKLGCNLSYSRLGRMYQYGEGVSRNLQKALDFYKEGARKENYVCYLGMAQLFLDANNMENAGKCLFFFFRDREAFLSKLIDDQLRVESSIVHLHADQSTLFVELDSNALQQLKGMRNKLLESVNLAIEVFRERSVRQELLNKYVATRNWISSL